MADNAAAEGRLAEGGKLTLKMLTAYVRARTDAPVSEKGDDLSNRVAALSGKPVVVRLGLEPDGYSEWLSQDAAKGDCEVEEPKPAEELKSAPLPLRPVRQTRAA